MGRGRTPCCSKIGLKKGPWSLAEDHRLIDFVQKHGHSNWRALPKQAGLLRCGKSCRLRWINYLRPDIKRGNFTPEEEETIINLHESLGNKWSIIASHLPGRTDNEIKNVWNTHLKKRVLSKGSNPSGDEPEKSSISTSSSTNSSCVSSHDQGIGMENGEDAQPVFMSAESPIEEYMMMFLENKQAPLLNPLFNDWDFPLDDRIHHGSNKNIWDNDSHEEPNPLIDDLKELSSPSNSTCSSYVTHSKLDHGTIPQGETHPQIECDILGEVWDTTIQEMNNEQDHNGDILEIPFDPNIGPFDMFDETPYCENKTQQQEVSEEESKGEVESKKWVTYLENELGLQSTCNDKGKEILTKDVVEPTDTTTSSNEVPLDAEIDPVAVYFQMWPSSLHNF